MGTSEQRELIIYIQNNEQLHRQQEVPIQTNLLRKMGKNTFDAKKSEKLWGYLADSGAQAYTKEFDGPNPRTSFGAFSKDDRKAVAAEMAKDFIEEVKQGEHAVIITQAEKKKRDRALKMSSKLTQAKLDRAR